MAAIVAAILLGLAGPDHDAVRQAVDDGVAWLVASQDGAEWPYEGVYRVKREIPVGYRVGGTAITAMALLEAPGFAGDDAQQAAVRRGAEFVVDSIRDPLMAHEVQATYDVRGWGYTYGLALLLTLERRRIETPGARGAIDFFIEGIEATSIPDLGGWNYARRGGFDAPGPAATFMTAPTLMALYAARAQGHDVDDVVVDAGLDALERARTETGAIGYASDGRRQDAVAGATGRMLCTEIALDLAGRGSAERLRGALDAFLAHWRWLDDRRAKDGTHKPPYGVAPYYFYFAHYYAAQAIELLPDHERSEYRDRLVELLMTVRRDDGSWNDRVFERSAAYGTSMAVLALVMPDVPAPARWQPRAVVDEPTPRRGN